MCASRQSRSTETRDSTVISVTCLTACASAVTHAPWRSERVELKNSTFEFRPGAFRQGSSLPKGYRTGLVRLITLPKGGYTACRKLGFSVGNGDLGHRRARLRRGPGCSQLGRPWTHGAVAREGEGSHQPTVCPSGNYCPSGSSEPTNATGPIRWACSLEDVTPYGCDVLGLWTGGFLGVFAKSQKYIEIPRHPGFPTNFP